MPSREHARKKNRIVGAAVAFLLVLTAPLMAGPVFAAPGDPTAPPVDTAAPADPAVDPVDPATDPITLAQIPVVPGFPAATEHTQQSFPPDSDFTSKWTRADARQIMAMSDTTVPATANSLPEDYIMPTIPQDFPIMTDEVWVWDTWSLTNGNADQLSYKGWDVIFSLVADRAIAFDDRHTHARLGYFFRKSGIPTADRPENGGWTYGGHVFPDGASGAIFEDQSFSTQTEWSGSTRIFEGNKIRIFYTSVAFYRDANEVELKPADPRIVQSPGRIFADETGVWFTGLRDQHQLLVPDGTYYQTREQNPFVNFRDPFTFTDPAYPDQTFMVFEGNTGGERGAVACTDADLGYAPGDPYAETAAEVTAQGANFQMANVGLAVADNLALTEWHFLPPILSANCVNDQTERPQIYLKDGKYYLFTISHRSTYSVGVTGPDGVYGFVGDGVRSDFQPLNRGSGLALGNPTDLNTPAGSASDPNPEQNPNAYQAYSHYVMPGGYVQSFIDAIGGPGDLRRGGTLSPTVKININGADTAVDRTYGTNGLGGYADIPTNLAQPVSPDPDPRPTP